MKLCEIIHCLEQAAPVANQESYDNSGLQVGHVNAEISGALICLDVTGPVLEEAIESKLNLIISHHPLIFGSIRSLTGRNAVEQMIAKAIKHDIAIYSAHTNLDNTDAGVSRILAEKLQLTNMRVLQPAKDILCKLVTFCPASHANAVRDAIFESGAGVIGQYDCCSFNTEGTGTFRAGQGANPFVGETGKLHREEEVRIETIFPRHLENNLIKALLQAHPYEEVAYDIYPLNNRHMGVGAGVIGELEAPMDEQVFMLSLKKTVQATMIRHSGLRDAPIRKVAICGGSGSQLSGAARRAGADIFITADIKYHIFAEAGGKMIIADIGHYESEQFSRELLFNIIIKKFPTFAVQISDLEANPIKTI